jgi:hypothetical protein
VTRILILSQGRVQEYGALKDLKQKEGSVLNSLLKSDEEIKEYL